MGVSSSPILQLGTLRIAGIKSSAQHHGRARASHGWLAWLGRLIHHRGAYPAPFQRHGHRRGLQGSACTLSGGWPGGDVSGVRGGAIGYIPKPSTGRCSIRGHGGKRKVRARSLKPKGEAVEGERRGSLVKGQRLGLDPPP